MNCIIIIYYEQIWVSYYYCNVIYINVIYTCWLIQVNNSQFGHHWVFGDESDINQSGDGSE